MSIRVNGSLFIHESLNYEHQSLYECLVLVYLANSHVHVAMVPLFVFVVDISFIINNAILFLNFTLMNLPL